MPTSRCAAIASTSGHSAEKWKQRLIAALLLPELLYALFLIATFAVAAKDFLLGRRGSWYAT